LPNAFNTWRRYRGGMAPYIWIYDTRDHSVQKVPHTTASDTFPRWHGEEILFLSDRDRVMNLYAFTPKNGQIRPITRFTGADIKTFGCDGKRAVIERDGYLHLLNLGNGEARKLTIDIPAEAVNTRPHFADAKRTILSWDISPSGKRLVMEARGDILTVPAEKGDIRNLTRSTGAAERSPAWSPDGEKIAYFGEVKGEYALQIIDQKGYTEPRIIPFADPGYYSDIVWSPDSKKITFKDNRLNLWLLDLEADNTQPVKVDTNTYFNFYRDLNASWSPDGQWIAYDKLLPNFLHAIHLYSVADNQSHRITDGMSDAVEPMFDKNGKYLYFLASTNRAQGVAWLDMTSIEADPTMGIYAVVLSAEEPSPFQPESDEEKAEKTADKDKEKDADKEKDKPEEAAKTGVAAAPAGGPRSDEAEKAKDADKGKEKDKAKPTRIDLAGIEQRIVSVDVPSRAYASLQTGSEGKFFYLENIPNAPGFHLHRYDLKKRKDEQILSGLNSYRVSANGKKLGYQQGGNYFIVDAEGPVKPGDGKLKLDNLEVWSDPPAEWRQMLFEAWRINREWFYDPGMHGQDWPKIWKQYEAFLPYIAHRSDLNYVIGMMIGELAIGHAYVGGGDMPDVDRVPGGLLGADYEVADNLYRFKKIYQGENWNPDLRAPLTEPGVKARQGDYILEVDGRPLTGKTNIFSLFLETADKQVRLKLNDKPSADGAWEVTVVPVRDETTLRYRDWLERNRLAVDKLSGGRLAYVFLPDTAGQGFTNFNRYYFAQVEKEGVVVDERYNGGGLIADYYIQFLNRPLTTWWLHRYGKNISSPFGSIYGPKVLLINEFAGSGGDAFPYLFHQAGIGPMVGKRTWGGLVGITGYPRLLDGGFVTSPSISIVSTDGKFVVENVGVPPDIEVEITPADFIAGRDPQLEKAVAVALEELKAKPVPKFHHEPFPRGR
jgi:tricorn protease